MKCPRCGVLLSEITKAGVLVDVCDRCLGMWLDQGELEKVVARIRELECEHAQPRGVDRAAPAPPAHPQAPYPPYPPDPRYAPYPSRHHDDDHGHDEHHGSQQHRGWRRMLDIFD